MAYKVRSTILCLLIALSGAAILLAGDLIPEGRAVEAGTIKRAYGEAIKLHRAGRYQAAVTRFNKVIIAEPFNMNAVYYSADCYYRMGDVSKAVTLYSAILKKFPGTVAAHYARRALLSIGRAPIASVKPSAYSSSQEEPSSTSVASVPGSARVPFRRETNGHMEVSCKINGRHQKMIFDTGAAVCVASKSHLQSLGLSLPTSAPTGTATGVSGTVRTWLMPVDIQLGDIKRRVTLSVLDTLPTLPLLGEAFFSGMEYAIDNSTETIEFSSPGSTASQTPLDTIDIPFRRQGHELMVEARVNGRPVNLFFDTGADRTVFPRSVMSSGGGFGWTYLTSGTASGVGGTNTCDEYRINSLELGPIKQYDFKVVVVRQLPVPNGLLGQDFYGNRKYTIDNQHNKIRFWR